MSAEKNNDEKKIKKYRKMKYEDHYLENYK